MELNFIQWVQSWHSPLLDETMLWITMFGGEEFYLLLGPIIFWCFGSAIGMRLLIVLLSSFYINDWLKQSLATIRPGLAFPADVRVPAGALETAQSADGSWSGAFPSGHAQGSLTFWGYVALWARRPVVMVIAAGAVLLVGLSRIYLGLHWPIDILGGWLLALLLLGGLFALTPLAAGMQLRMREQVLLGSALVALVLALVDESPDRARMLGFWSGAGVGYILQQRYVPLAVQAPLRLQVAKVALGLAGLFGLRIVLKAMLPELAWAVCLRYSILGLWVVVLAPLVFRRLPGAPDSVAAQAAS